mmetsp:Transcript_7978/g.15734  ORF Transcript_7978/g.15734 Transcript_7978/m.15734 type:complete len:394 (-) Transcript_7978:185-1366(-)
MSNSDRIDNTSRAPHADAYSRSQKPSTCWAELFGGGAFRRVLPGLTRGEPLPPPKRRRAACPGCNWQSIAIGSCSLLCTDCLNLIQPPDSNQPPHDKTGPTAAPGDAPTQELAGSTSASTLSSNGSFLCEEIDCGIAVSGGQDSPFCHLHRHLPWTQCEHEGCNRRTRVGTPALCKSHGGGRRCTHQGCSRMAAAGSPLCTTHGGCRRCQHRGCDRAARAGGAPFCASHGGGKRCEYPGCDSAARAGLPSFCFAHGGGPRCAVANCNERAQTRSKHRLCAAHARHFARACELRHCLEHLQFPRAVEHFQLPHICEEIQIPLQANHYQPSAYAYDSLIQKPMNMPATSTAWQMPQASYVTHDASNGGYSYVDPSYESNMGPAVKYLYYGSSWGV